MSSSVLVETHDRWLLPLAGRTVERMCLDHALTLVFDGGFELRIEQPSLSRLPWAKRSCWFRSVIPTVWLRW